MNPTGWCGPNRTPHGPGSSPPLEGCRTRLVTRLKVRYPKTLSAFGTIALIELGDFVMMRRMLLTLRLRATTPRHAAEAGKETAMDPDAASPTTTTRLSVRDVAHAAQGVAVMLAAFATPMLRAARSYWGLPADQRQRIFPGDDLVHRPRWQWAHAVDIAAPAEAVWPWVAQIGADRAGFYSYELLENLAGCRIHNAEHLQPRWAVQPGDALSIHPNIPPLPIVAIEPGRWFIAHAAPPDQRPPQRKGDVAVTWLFLVEPTGPATSRIISRYRCATAGDLATRLQFGPTLIEPISFAMDRAMLRGIKARVQQ